MDTDNLADYMEIALPAVGRVFETPQVALVDYREHSNDFVLLHWEGYPTDARYALQRRLADVQIETALSTREPYTAPAHPNQLCLPLYFRDILEAVLVLEYSEPTAVSPAQREASEVCSKFLGLLMSSARLKVNQEHLVDLEDLKTARHIQLSHLPAEHPSTDTYEVFGLNQSSSLVGGDYFDYFRHHENSVQCVLADACGHGMAAALIVTTFRGLLHSEVGRREHYHGLFDKLNEAVHAGHDLIQYLTSVFLDYDEQARRLRYFNAGHYDPLVIDHEGNLRALPGGGPPLGMFRSSSYQLHDAQLAPGDVVTLFTDGLADIQSADCEFF